MRKLLWLFNMQQMSSVRKEREFHIGEVFTHVTFMVLHFEWRLAAGDNQHRSFVRLRDRNCIVDRLVICNQIVERHTPGKPACFVTHDIFQKEGAGFGLYDVFSQARIKLRTGRGTLQV